MSAPPQPLALSRETLRAHVIDVLEPGSGRDPVVSLVRDGDRVVVVKDYASRAWWVRAIVGRFMNMRELRAYRALAGHPAVPRLLGVLDAYAFAVEYRPGERMSRRLAATLPAGFVEALDAAVREMHARGVVHLDLRHRTNILMDDAGRPVLIDFASALCFRPQGLGARCLLPLLAWIDRRAVHKWAVRLAPVR